MGKFYIKFIILLFLYSCSYQPIFNDKQYNFEFKNIYLSGQDHINNLLKKELEKINGEKKYDISIFAEKNRIILSSDNKGDPVTFKLIILVKFEIIKNNEKILVEEIRKQTNYNNIKDKFELSKVEENITTNLIKKISEELLISISNIKND